MSAGSCRRRRIAGGRRHPARCAATIPRSTIYAIVRATDGQPCSRPRTSSPWSSTRERLAPRSADRRRRLARSRYSKGLGAAEYSALYQNPDEALRAIPKSRELYLSKDATPPYSRSRRRAPCSVKQIERLARDSKTDVPAGSVHSRRSAATPAEHNDFDHYMFRSLPKIVGFVVGATLIMLFFAFRSYLLPVEAVLMNLLAVAAGIGAVVAVFQLGWLNGLVGLERPFSAIPLEVPMMVFCLSFGLSMDYELFLLFRIKREYAIDAEQQSRHRRGPRRRGAGHHRRRPHHGRGIRRVRRRAAAGAENDGSRPVRRGAGGRHGDPHIRRPRRHGARRPIQLVPGGCEPRCEGRQSIGLPQRASTPRRSRIAGNTSLFQSAPCAS